MSKKTQAKKIVRISLDHDRVRDEFPIGTRYTFGDQEAIVTGHELIDTMQGKCLWVKITNVKTGDWFNADPYYWGLQARIKA